MANNGFIAQYTETKHPPLGWSLNATVHQTQEVTIAAGTSVSTTLNLMSEDMKGYAAIAVFTPAGWRTAKISIQVSYDGTSWFPLHQWFATAYDTANNVMASQCHTIDGYPLRGMPFVRFVSGTAASPTNQTSTVTLTILCGTI
jgi:hypothetical protein